MKRYLLITMVCLALTGGDAIPKSIRDSKHNLSFGGSGVVTAATEGRICVFCHTTHKGSRSIPLWNRADTTAFYTIYHSSTIQSDVGQPTGTSRVCLSCHDGTIALGAVLSEPRDIPFKGGIRSMPESGRAKLGTDLSDDHPVSFVYDGRLAELRGELKDPTALPSNLRLDADRRLQCTTCHDPHDDVHGKFLVLSDRFSQLCAACHVRDGWTENPHSFSDASLNQPGIPTEEYEYRTVAENGCENCHLPHSGKGGERLMKFRFEEDNCLVCHNGSMPGVPNIETEIVKPYGHRVQNYTGLHDAAEDFTFGNVPVHVECSDCHNPHKISDDPSPGGEEISGANRGVKGINPVGEMVTEIRFKREICYKCHGNENAMRRISVPRQIDGINVRKAFDPANPSFHPLETRGANPDVPSLIPPYSPNSLISCADCHNSDNPSVKGPHGSNHRFLLAANYETSDRSPESAHAYELCYNCHARNSILADESFPYHNLHVAENSTSCAICHDPHGIDSLQGNALNNSHLINFDMTTVSANGRGELRFEDLGVFEGQCFLTCHGKPHEPKAYPKRK